MTRGCPIVRVLPLITSEVTDSRPLIAPEQELIQRLRQHVAALVPVDWIAGQAAHDDRVQLRRHLLAVRAGREDGLAASRIDGAEIGAAREQPPSGQALPEHDAETEEVGAPIDRAPVYLL